MTKIHRAYELLCSVQAYLFGKETKQEMLCQNTITKIHVIPCIKRMLIAFQRNYKTNTIFGPTRVNKNNNNY